MAEPMTDARLEQIRDWVRGAPRPGGEWRIIQELATETHHQRAENDRLRTIVDERDAALEDCETVVAAAHDDTLRLADGVRDVATTLDTLTKGGHPVPTQTVTAASRHLRNLADATDDIGALERHAREQGLLVEPATETAEEVADLRLSLEGWQRTTAELTRALADVVDDWSMCSDDPGDCPHCRAVSLLIREGDKTEGVVAHPYANCTCCGHYRCEHGEEICLVWPCGCLDWEDEEPDDCEHCGGTGECQEAHPCGYDHSCAVCGTSGTSAGSSPAHPHPDIAALRKQAAAEGAQAIPALLAAIDWLAGERDEAVTAHDLARVHWLADNGQLWAERARLREVHTGIRRLITAWETRPGTFDTPSAANVLRDLLGGEDVAFADEPAELTADHTLRTAAGQEASDAHQ